MFCFPVHRFYPTCKDWCSVCFTNARTTSPASSGNHFIDIYLSITECKFPGLEYTCCCCFSFPCPSFFGEDVIPMSHWKCLNWGITNASFEGMPQIMILCRKHKLTQTWSWAFIWWDIVNYCFSLIGCYVCSNYLLQLVGDVHVEIHPFFSSQGLEQNLEQCHSPIRIPDLVQPPNCAGFDESETTYSIRRAMSLSGYCPHYFLSESHTKCT